MRRPGEQLWLETRLVRTVAVAGALVFTLSGSAFVSRVSVSKTGAAADYLTPTFTTASVSTDGRFVAFDSGAGNLASNAPDGGVFVRDTQGGTTDAVSIRANGTVDDESDTPAISGDGRFVAFVSDDRLLVPGGNSNFTQVFLRDRTAGVTTRVSSKPNGNQGTDDSDHPSLSRDGRYIAFDSDSPGLVTGDTNEWTDVFVRDRLANTTKRVSLTSTGAQADIGGSNPSISADGRLVAFESPDTLTPNDTNPYQDVYVRDVVANTTTLVSLTGGGGPADGTSSSPQISGNGRYVVFMSEATDLDGLADTNGGTDVFVRDLVAGTTQRVSLSSTGALAHGDAIRPTISSTGRFVAYESTAADAVAGDTNAVADGFVYDRTLAQTSRVTTDSAGAQLVQGGTQPVVSGDGRVVIFASTAQVTGLAASPWQQLYTRLTVPANSAAVPPVMSIGNASVVEGDLRSRQLKFTVTLSHAATTATSVHYETVAGTATAGTDFVAKSGTLTIPAGALAGLVSVDVKGDRVVEPQEAFTVKLSAPVGATLGHANGTGSIATDDNPTNPTVRVSIGNATVVEGDSGARGLRFAVTLSASSPGVVTVHYATVVGTAGTADFATKSGTVSIPARATSTVVNIAVRPDFLLEKTETFKVKLSLPTGATLKQATGTGTILDDA